MELKIVSTSSALPVSVLSLLVAAGSFLVYILHRYLSIDYDPREPPIIKSRIPYVGHILGIIRYGTKYFKIVK